MHDDRDKWVVIGKLQEPDNLIHNILVFPLSLLTFSVSLNFDLVSSIWLALFLFVFQVPTQNGYERQTWRGWRRGMINILSLKSLKSLLDPFSW